MGNRIQFNQINTVIQCQLLSEAATWKLM